jgi:catechol 2,3-dioxygenase-like lactoylglutathione lyase family enzyme
MNIDHVVLWVNNPKQSLDFYADIFGFAQVRAEEYAEGKVPFPSVRINEDCIFDLMDRKMLAAAKSMTGGDAGGHVINHVCLNMNASSYEKVKSRLKDKGISVKAGPESSFGAKGYTPHSVYFEDPDGNIIEIRYYE